MGAGQAVPAEDRAIASWVLESAVAREGFVRGGFWIWLKICRFRGLGGPGAPGTPFDRPGPPRTSICTKKSAPETNSKAISQKNPKNPLKAFKMFFFDFLGFLEAFKRFFFDFLRFFRIVQAFKRIFWDSLSL